jgi:hypothetical protein
MRNMNDKYVDWGMVVMEIAKQPELYGWRIY